MEEHKAFIGGKEIKEFYVGNQQLDEIWCGNVLFWKKNTVKDYFEFTYSGATSFPAAGSISISVDDVEKWSGDYVQMKNFSLPSGGTNVKIRGNLTDITFLGTRITNVLTPFPATMSEKVSFSECFRGCQYLTTIPGNLFANCPNVTTFLACFMGCDALRAIPGELFSNCPKVTDFSHCFLGDRISSIPENLFSSCTEVTTFQDCFGHCQYLTAIPQKLFANCPNVTTFRMCFMTCDALRAIPGELFSNCPKVTDFSHCFSEDRISSIPENLFSSCTEVTTFQSCFERCKNITTIPENLFANCPNIMDFSYCFSECGRDFNTSIMTGRAPELWVTHPNANGKHCFWLTWGFENDKDIPSSWK